MLRHDSHWGDAAFFIGLVLIVALAFSATIWPQSSALAADSFAHMLQGVKQVFRGL